MERKNLLFIVAGVVGVIGIFFLILWLTNRSSTSVEEPVQEIAKKTNLSNPLTISAGSISVGEVPEMSSYTAKEYYPSRDINELIFFNFSITVPYDEAVDLIDKVGLSVYYKDSEDNYIGLIDGRGWNREAVEITEGTVLTHNDRPLVEGILTTFDARTLPGNVYVGIYYDIDDVRYNYDNSVALQSIQNTSPSELYTPVKKIQANIVDEDDEFLSKIEEVIAGTLSGFESDFSFNVGTPLGIDPELVFNIDEDIFIHLQAPHRLIALPGNLRFKVEDDSLNVYSGPNVIIEGLRYTRVNEQLDSDQMTYVLTDADDNIIHLVKDVSTGVVTIERLPNTVDEAGKTYKLNFVRYSKWNPIKYLLPVPDDKQQKIKYFTSDLNNGRFPGVIYNHYGTPSKRFNVQNDNNIVIRRNDGTLSFEDKHSNWIGQNNLHLRDRVQIVLEPGKVRVIDIQTDEKPADSGLKYRTRYDTWTKYGTATRSSVLFFDDDGTLKMYTLYNSGTSNLQDYTALEYDETVA